MTCKHPTCPPDGCRRPKKPGIKKMSDKRKVQNSLYIQKRNAYMKSNPFCAAHFLHCLRVATTIHHKEGRIGDLLTDETKFIGLCLHCHAAIELNPDWAKRNGYSVSRLHIDPGLVSSTYPESLED